MLIKARGFTLIELMVSVSIFTTVAVIATGAVLTANQINQQSQAIKLVMDNLSFALDSMTLKMKQGGSFYCLSATDGRLTGATVNYPDDVDFKNCESGNSAVAFRVERSDGGVDQFIYRIHQVDAITKRLEFSKFELGNMTSFTPMTTSDIVLNTDGLNSRFYVFNGGQPDKEPRVIISLAGRATIGRQFSDFAIQTTVSDRR